MREQQAQAQLPGQPPGCCPLRARPPTGGAPTPRLILGRAPNPLGPRAVRARPPRGRGRQGHSYRQRQEADAGMNDLLAGQRRPAPRHIMLIPSWRSSMQNRGESSTPPHAPLPLLLCRPAARRSLPSQWSKTCFLASSWILVNACAIWRASSSSVGLTGGKGCSVARVRTNSSTAWNSRME